MHRYPHKHISSNSAYTLSRILLSSYPPPHPSSATNFLGQPSKIRNGGILVVSHTFRFLQGQYTHLPWAKETQPAVAVVDKSCCRILEAGPVLVTRDVSEEMEKRKGDNDRARALLILAKTGVVVANCTGLLLRISQEPDRLISDCYVPGSKSSRSRIFRACLPPSSCSIPLPRDGD